MLILQIALRGLRMRASPFSMDRVDQGDVPFAAFAIDRDGGMPGRGFDRVRE